MYRLATVIETIHQCLYLHTHNCSMLRVCFVYSNNCSVFCIFQYYPQLLYVCVYVLYTPILPPNCSMCMCVCFVHCSMYVYMFSILLYYPPTVCVYVLYTPTTALCMCVCFDTTPQLLYVCVYVLYTPILPPNCSVYVCMCAIYTTWNKDLAAHSHNGHI